MELRVALVLLASILAVACTPTRHYQTDPTPRPDAHGVIKGGIAAELRPTGCVLANREVAVVEFDDYGNLFNRTQLNCAVDGVAGAARDGAVVLVYVHGWHHSAQTTEDSSDDLKKFRNFVKQFARRSAATQSLSQAPGQEVPVVGVFVGWRGDSIESSGITMPLSYALTFWDRKAAAQNIGNSGGVTELFFRLEQVRTNFDSTGTKLVAIGHSFGGALLYSALSSRLLDQALADQRSFAASQGAPPEPQTRRFSPDVLVLVNPAIEAMRFKPYLDLVRRWPHGMDVPPRLIIATSSADWATGYAFPIGRMLSTTFASYSDPSDAAVNKSAIGHYDPFVTHQLVVDAKGCPNPKMLVGPDLVQASSNALCVSSPDEDSGRVGALVLTRCDAAGTCGLVSPEHFLARSVTPDFSDGRLPNRLPYANIRVSPDVMSGHNDIWNTQFKAFLVDGLLGSLVDPSKVPLVRHPVTLTK